MTEGGKTFWHRVGYCALGFLVLGAAGQGEHSGAVGIAGAVLLCGYAINRRLGELRDALERRNRAP